MARVEHVKKAQQRYKMVPVLNPDGSQKITRVMARNGQPKTDKRGKEIVMRNTVADKSQPLPPLSCDFAGCDIDGGKILVGTPYKHITPKSGPYGGTQRNRHEAHPTWNVWEYSYSTSARVQQIQHEAQSEIDGIEDEDSARAAAESIVGMIKELADEKNASADSMEEGFGHETYQSQEIREVAEQLESWADEVEQFDVPDMPQGERWFVFDHDNNVYGLEDGYDTEDEAQAAAEEFDADPEDQPQGPFDVRSEEADEPSTEQLEEWLDEVRSALQDVVDTSPV